MSLETSKQVEKFSKSTECELNHFKVKTRWEYRRHKSNKNSLLVKG